MGVHWQPLSSQSSQWDSNFNALKSARPELAEALAALRPQADYHFAIEGSVLHLGKTTAAGIQQLPNRVNAASARDISIKLFPTGTCTEPAMVAGLDQGWLWSALYALECNTPRIPGHRPPLYFLARDVEQLWVVMHLQDWQKLMADPRAQLFVGPDAVEQCRRSMHANTHIPWAKLCVTVDPTIWPSGVTVDSLWQTAHQAANQRMDQLNRQVESLYAGTDVKAIARRLRGEKLRILGITSHFTTFLKYSMADWLDAMRELGHDTRLAMESADHEITNPVFYAEQIVEFKPDLILMIDHYRGEIPGLPRQIPCVMWVQDNLPNIFTPQAGAAQGPRDYCLGFGRLKLRDANGYPEQRFMPAQVGVNDARFSPRELTADHRDAHTCDVSFVSHASVPATVILTEQLNRAEGPVRKMLIDVFEQMRSVYDGGGAITQPLIIQQMIESSIFRARLQFDNAVIRQLNDLFTQRINNAMFRHQSLTWLAEMGVDLRIYGRGWESHPRLGRYARGIACNQTQLSAIFQASRINMQITPYGAVHQRLFEGLSAGGFFLLRHVPGDEIESVYRELHDWCVAKDIQSDDELRKTDSPEVLQLLEASAKLIQADPFATGHRLIDTLRFSADGGYIRSAATVWNEYDQVAYRSAGELQERVTRFLSDEPQRRAIADSMRKVVLERFTYKSVSQRLLEFVADDLARAEIRVRAAA